MWGGKRTRERTHQKRFWTFQEPLVWSVLDLFVQDWAEQQHLRGAENVPDEGASKVFFKGVSFVRFSSSPLFFLPLHGALQSLVSCNIFWVSGPCSLERLQRKEAQRSNGKEDVLEELCTKQHNTCENKSNLFYCVLGALRAQGIKHFKITLRGGLRISSANETFKRATH